MRVRVRFTKLGKIRWTSHRDVARMWERAFRRAQISVAQTEGFTPRQKVSFGLALPTGHESVAEYLDAELLTEDIELASLPGRLSQVLPAGIDVVAVAVVPTASSSLQESVTSCTWELEAIGAPYDEVQLLVSQALAAESIVITRQRKGTDITEDVRPAITAVDVAGAVVCESEGHAPGAVLVAELATQPRSLRPAELLAAMSSRLSEGHVRRIHQWSTRDGARWEPLPLDATNAPHAEVRAS
ncbi:MAG: TIGR03936 family radical SAM-associated protein [Acidimicrobiales bacterium]